MIRTDHKPATITSKAAPSGGQQRACIITSEVEGPFFNGGVGSTNRGLALALRQLGCAVDILYTQVVAGQPVCLRGSFAGHVAEYARLGIRLLAIPNRAGAGDWAARSWLSLQHLLTERYDLAFFDDIFGTGYYPLLARRTGAPELANTAMVVTAHGALEWVSEQDEAAILNFDGLPLYEMERRSLELADVVRAPSHYILQKYRSFGWSLPDSTVVMPNFVSAPKPRQATALKRVAVEEVVFFGRLETRKGVWLFLRAIDRIKYRLAGRTITFLGKSCNSAAPILRHAMGWPCKVRLITTFNQDQALAYLHGPGRLAVMPSPEDNSPSTVLECLDHAIPFLTSSGSGAEELIDPACHEANLFSPTVEALAEQLLSALETGGRSARHAFDSAGLLDEFGGFLTRTLQGAVAPPQTAAAGPVGMIALAPACQAVVASATQTRQALAALGPEAVLNVLCDQPQALQSLVSDPRLQIFGPDDLAKAATTLASRAPVIVGFSALGSIPGTEWFDRATLCLAGDVVALTGMARSWIEPEKTLEEPWFSAAPKIRVARHLMGNASALMTLEQSTNSGFALLHPDVLDLLPRLDSFDPRQGRMRSVTVILHELMAAITATGRRFELVPDLVAPPSDMSDGESEGIALKLAARWLDAPTDALWSVNRLGVDAGIDRIRHAEGVATRAALAQKLGFAVDPVAPDTPWPRQATDLARLAGAVGQPDLAVELLANLHPVAEHLRHDKLADFIRAEAAAISLAERHRKGAFLPVNLIHHYSALHLTDSEFQLHANAVTEPRAAIAFPDVDLTQLEAFSARVSLPDGNARPVRLRIDILADSGPEHLTIERVLKPGESTELLVDLPPDLRVPCRVVVGVEMADPMAPHDNAYVRLSHPRFLRRGGGA